LEHSVLSEPNALFLVLGAAIVLAGGVGIAFLLSNIDQGLSLFKYLYVFSMLVSAVTLCLFAVEVILGNLETRSNWLTAFGACFVGMLSIFYGFFGVVHSHRGPLEASKTSSDFRGKVL
jgi:hypothetical protein